LVTVAYALRGSNGEVIDFDFDNYVLNQGMIGFGITPTTIRIEPSAGVGGVFRHSQRGIRDIDLPITIIGTDRNDVQTKLRKLARITQDQRGPMRLRATYSNGEQLFIDLHYTGGAESEWGADTAGQVFCRWVLSTQAPQPFWETATAQSFTIAGGATGRGLLPQMTKLLVSSSDALGIVEVQSTADVESYPVWTVNGPVTDLTISSNDQSFTIEGAIGFGEVIVIDTEAKTVVDGDGANVYNRLGPAPKLFPFFPGTNTIEVSGTGSDSNTLITAEYALRYEVVHG
jgi:hypothetical protein